MKTTLQQLREAEGKAVELFRQVEVTGLIKSGKSEGELNTEVFDLAFEMFGIKKYWHKRIVRAGRNTLFPYRENPPDLVLQEDDVVFFDFGPVFDEWEADVGRTYVLGSDARKLKLAADVEAAWNDGKRFYDANLEAITSKQMYNYTEGLAKKYGWEFGNIHCGHLIGEFPHEKIVGEDRVNYLHPDNDVRMCERDKNGNERFWIYEIHFVDRLQEIGGFFEQVLS